MPRLNRLFAAAALSTLAALLPVTAFASDLTRYVFGAQYAVGEPCTDGTTSGTISSFAGFGSTTPGGRANAVFNTRICHTEIKSTGAAIIPGGSFTIATSSLLLVGRYAGGFVHPALHSPPRSCNEVFPVDATFAASGKITGGGATGFLTHYGVRIDGVCHAFAATITGWAMLHY